MSHNGEGFVVAARGDPWGLQQEEEEHHFLSFELSLRQPTLFFDGKERERKKSHPPLQGH